MRKIVPILCMMLTLYLGVHNGYLALWEKGACVPNTIYPYKVSLYPQIDRTTLENGIVVHSDLELNQLLENFLS